MPRQRHWINNGVGGDTVFLTTTVLDFVHAFRRDEPRSAMAKAIHVESRLARAVLHAYVVMPHHIHILATMHEAVDPRSFMRRFKPGAAASVRPLLTAVELAQFDQQTGLNRHRFWQRSFRGIVVEGGDRFWGKVNYIHQNPVRAGYVDAPEAYQWSSARAFLDGLWSPEAGLPLR